MKKAFLLWLLVSAWAMPAWAKTVTVVLSRSIEAYEDALKGLRQDLQADLTPVNMNGNADEGQKIMQNLQGQKFDLTIAIGMEAANAAQAALNGKPFLYTMVYSPLEGADTNGFGVLMQISLEEQLAGLHKLFPAAKKIGVIYNPASSRKIIMLSRDLAQSRQLDMMPVAVENPDEIPVALGKMAEMKIDVLWSVVDRVTSGFESIQQMITFTLAHKIPFVGLSKYHVKAGALAAFAVDFNDLGRQTAVLAGEMLAQPDLKPRIEKPRTLSIFVNSTTQQTLGLAAFPSNLSIQYVNQAAAPALSPAVTKRE